MRVDHQSSIIDWLLDANERTVRICQTARDSALWDDDQPPQENDLRRRIAIVSTVGKAQAIGKKSRAKVLSQQEIWNISDNVSGESLSEAFHGLTADQWQYLVNVMAEGEEAAQRLALRWSLAMAGIPDEVLQPIASRA